MTVVRRILRTWPELPAATGDLACTSQPPLHHHKPKNGQLAQTAKSPVSFVGISANLRMLGAARKPELPRTRSRKQHVTPLSRNRDQGQGSQCWKQEVRTRILGRQSLSDTLLSSHRSSGCFLETLKRARSLHQSWSAECWAALA